MKDILKLSYFGLLVLLISCGNSSNPKTYNTEKSQQDEQKQSEQSEALTDTLVYVTKNYDRTFPECEGDDCPTYTLDYIEVEDSRYNFINDSIKVALIGKSASMDDAADDFLYEADENGASGFGQPWTHQMNANVGFNEKGFFTISYGFYEYVGGAHGMTGFSSDNYDLETKKKLAFYDMFNESDSTKLKTLGEKHFRKDNKLKPEGNINEQGYFWEEDFYLSETFTLTSKGLVFTYAPYEIGPYSIGMPVFTIPYTELKPFFSAKSPLKRLVK